MKLLDKELTTNGGIRYVQVKRDKYKAIYLSEQGVYEVFFIKVAEPTIIFGRSYPKREVFPSSEDFGKTAWCFNNLKAAERKWNQIEFFYQEKFGRRKSYSPPDQKMLEVLAD